MTKIIKEHCGKQYEIRVSIDEWNAVWVSVSEIVRPTWKIFRTRFIDHRIKFLDAFKSVEDAVNTSFLQIMLEEKKNEETREKIKKFKENY